MNRFAELTNRLATAGNDDQKKRLLADYLSATPAPDAAAALSLLAASTPTRRVGLGLLRGLTLERVDERLFALSLEFAGDAVETMALLWPAKPGANRDPGPAEILDAVTTLGRTELPRRIETWLDACSPDARRILIRIFTGALPTLANPGLLEAAARAAGIQATRYVPPRDTDTTQGTLFDTGSADTSGTIDAVLMYVEQGRSRTSPLQCTFGVWNGETLVAIGRGDGAELRALIEPFVRDNTERRFGPAREVAHTQERGLVLSVSFEGLQTSNRKKSGLALTNPRIIAVRADRTPSEAAHMQDIEELLPGIRPHA